MKNELHAVKNDTNNTNQMTLKASFIKAWNIDHESSQALIRKITRFICLDQQLISIVEDEDGHTRENVGPKKSKMLQENSVFEKTQMILRDRSLNMAAGF
uniref:Uncharacterized protein n=1 Tax=Romanomermis culicivorax TaxID=13658 RepID=A0A915IGW0_ROMCU